MRQGPMSFERARRIDKRLQVLDMPGMYMRDTSIKELIVHNVQ